MPERSKDWLNQAVKDLKVAEEMIFDLMRILSKKIEVNDELLNCARNLDKYYVPTRYPNGFESGSPYEYFTRRDAENAIVCGRRIIEFCKDILA